MEKSILRSVMNTLSVPADYDVFNDIIMTHINATFVKLQDLGVGPVNGFMIEDETATWDDYLPNDPQVNAIKTYMYLAVRILFDPPNTSWGLDAMRKQAEEMEWRINVRREATEYFHDDPRVDISLPISKRPVLEDYS